MSNEIFDLMDESTFKRMEPWIKVLNTRSAKIIIPLYPTYGIEYFIAVLLYSCDLYCKMIYESCKVGYPMDSKKYYTMIRDELRSRDSLYVYPYRNSTGKVYNLQIHPRDIPMNQVASVLYYALRDFNQYKKQIMIKFKKTVPDYATVKKFIYKESRHMRYLSFHVDKPIMKANNMKLFNLEELFGNNSSLNTSPELFTELGFKLDKPPMLFKLSRLANMKLHQLYNLKVITKIKSGYFVLDDGILQLHGIFGITDMGTSTMIEQLEVLHAKKEAKKHLIVLEWSHPFVYTRTSKQLQKYPDKYTGDLYVEYFPLLQGKYMKKIGRWKPAKRLLDSITRMAELTTEKFGVPINKQELYDFCVENSDKMLLHIQVGSKFDFIEYAANNYFDDVIKSHDPRLSSIKDYLIWCIRDQKSLFKGE